ncbi:GDSL-type esterase/lipase family protein [Mangrovibacterium marinum]|uniref:Lysophospholipase L1-like esterase n=1 Tax=Mangrovibacterium marinum TaxID=1639118 RepID=A0A2T5C214_9BACT|nr:GDSL-type esterase/lipase family protein [Mangrovibacterium marinum]PTN08687.1 lysophospholipase L1-like esterase [Mangrovibacterium marinum]
MFLLKTRIAMLWCAMAFFMAATSANGQTSKVKMACIGNSITAGVYDHGKKDLQVSYATQFGKLMTAIYGDTLEILNAGVSGRMMTKHGTQPIWIEPAFKKALDFAPDICLIALGTNDSKPVLFDLVQKEFYNDYQAMIDTFRSINPNVTVVVCLPPPIFEGHTYSPTSPHNDTLLVNYTIPLIDSIARNNQLTVVDFHTPFQDSLQYFTDHLHPSIEGHQKMGKILFNVFQKEDIIRKSLLQKDSIEAGETKVTK